MKLPNFQMARVPAAKITEYLLSEVHRDGKHKAAFFHHFGFSAEKCQTLEVALLQHASDHEVLKVEHSSFGTRYIVDGIITTPDGRTPTIRTVWFIRNEEDVPQFVTAYPLRRRDDDERTGQRGLDR